MSKHTPGPWFFSEQIGAKHAEVRDKYGRRIAVTIGYYPMRTRTEDANAWLIAAAPESHASNVELAEIVREMCRALRIPEPVEALARSDAAIAKAKGEV